MPVRELFRYPGPDTFRPDVTGDERRMVAGGPGHVLRVWDEPAGQELFSLPGHTAAVQTHAAADPRAVGGRSRRWTVGRREGGAGASRAVRDQLLKLGPVAQGRREGRFAQDQRD